MTQSHLQTSSEKNNVRGIKIRQLNLVNFLSWIHDNETFSLNPPPSPLPSITTNPKFCRLSTCLIRICFICILLCISHLYIYISFFYETIILYDGLLKRSQKKKPTLTNLWRQHFLSNTKIRIGKNVCHDDILDKLSDNLLKQSCRSLPSPYTSAAG